MDSLTCFECRDFLFNDTGHELNMILGGIGQKIINGLAVKLYISRG